MKSAGLAAFIAIVISACGPKPIGYIKINSPGTEGALVETVELYYSHEKAPMGAQVIEHVKETARNTDCRQAALIVLVQMQKKALKKGGNALIDLKVVPAGKEAQSSAEGFWCSRSKAFEEGADLTQKIWEISWEGDVARTVNTVEEGEPPAKKDENKEDSEGYSEDDL
jgi:hypothetical protein